MCVNRLCTVNRSAYNRPLCRPSVHKQQCCHLASLGKKGREKIVRCLGVFKYYIIVCHYKVPHATNIIYGNINCWRYLAGVYLFPNPRQRFALRIWPGTIQVSRSR